MCEGIKMCCVVCGRVICAYKNPNNKFINYNLFRCCKQFENCYKENFMFINIVRYYDELCKLCYRKKPKNKEKNYV